MVRAFTIDFHQPVGQAVACSSLEREVEGSNQEPVKSNTVGLLTTARYRCNIYSKEAVLPGRYKIFNLKIDCHKSVPLYGWN